MGRLWSLRHGRRRQVSRGLSASERGRYGSVDHSGQPPCSGSNYVYSAYAPQLASQLSINSTTVNLIGLAGNLGMYASGPM